MVAVGDIAAKDNLDAAVADRVAELAPDRLLLLGDIAYPNGSRANFENYFEPDWQRFSGIWMTLPGNHEYRTSGVAGYRAQFGVTGPLYWSTAVGAWRVIGLDSEQPRSQNQLRWLRRTLADNDGVPTVVAWHRARYSSGEHGDQRDTDALWKVVSVDPDVKVVLWGHDHDYERMSVPVAGRKNLVTMVVGTGGGELRATPEMKPRPWRKFYADQVLGALSLRLGSKRFSWSFVTAQGQVLDSGSRAL